MVEDLVKNLSDEHPQELQMHCASAIFKVRQPVHLEKFIYLLVLDELANDVFFVDVCSDKVLLMINTYSVQKRRRHVI